MSIFSISSLLIEADALSANYQPFLIQEVKNPKRIDMSIKQTTKPQFTNNFQRITELSNTTIWKGVDPQNRIQWIYELHNGIGTISIDADYSKVEFSCFDRFSILNKNEIGMLLSQFFQLIIQCKLIQNSFLVFHSACVELAGKAYAFTGPSGIGKSSRAKKWCELLSAEWISGDRPSIDCKSGIVYGVPWDGKESIYRNTNSPLAGIFKVKRSEIVSLKKMTNEEKLQLLFEQSFIPLWDTNLVARVLHSLRLLVKRIPIYELSCNISDESTYKAYDIIVDALHEMKGEIL